MNNLKIFCTSINYFKIIDKLPKYILPIGLGKESFPSNWIDEKKGENISHLNLFYGELTGIYWIWKNAINKMDENDFIGNCHYRKLWLDNLYNKKQKTSIRSLHSKLFKFNEKNLINLDAIQVQPIIFKNKNLFEDFFEIHKTDILKKSLEFFDDNTKISFTNHLNQKIFFPLNMFITKVKFFNEYCEILFPWLDKCLEYCKSNNLCESYNTRLPAFLAERFTSFWFSQKEKRICLSYARLGDFFLSNKINNLINPIKIPFTFRMYPTLHDY